MSKLTQNKKEQVNESGKQNEEKVMIRCNFPDTSDLGGILTLLLSGLEHKQTYLQLTCSGLSSFALLPTTHYIIADGEQVINFIGDFEYLASNGETKGTIFVENKERDDTKISIKYDLEKKCIETELEMLADLLSIATGLALKNVLFRTGALKYSLNSSEEYKFFISAANNSFLTQELFEKELVNYENKPIAENILKIIDKCNIYRNYKGIRTISIYLEDTTSDDLLADNSFSISFELEVVE